MEPLPRILYKLRSLTTENDWKKVSEMFQRKQVWFSSFDKFNDPFEGSISHKKSKTERQVAKRWADRVGAQYAMGNRASRREQIQSAARKVRHGYEINGYLPGLNEIGVCCLTESVDGLLAWSHYAGGHRRIAIGFHPNADLQANLFTFAHKVAYSIDKPNHMSFETALLTKAKCWDYEKEWRLIGDPAVPGSIGYGQGAPANSPANFSPSDLVEIRIGAKVSDIERRRLVALVSQSGLNPSFIRASLHPTKYELEFSPQTDTPLHGV